MGETGRRLAGGQGGLIERHGRVVDSHGEPVPGAAIAIVRSSMPMPEIALLGDDQGHFVLRLPHGTYTLQAHCEDGATGIATIGEAPGAEETTIVVNR